MDEASRSRSRSEGKKGRGAENREQDNAKTQAGVWGSINPLDVEEAKRTTAKDADAIRRLR
jgi:hypothetical protein